MPVTVRLPMEEHELLKPNPRERSWDSFGHRVWIQTDNQQLAQVLGGASVLQGDHYRPLFVRICRSLVKLHHRNIQPRTQTSEFVEWDPRDFNALADDAANKALDRGADWMHVHRDSVQKARASAANYRLCFDGARRGSGESAAGVAFLAYYATGERDLLLRAGKRLGVLSSAFLAEALAAEWCLDVFFSHFPITPSGG